MNIHIISILLLAFTFFCVYIQRIISVFGIRRSISDSNYFLKKPFKLMFEIVMWVCGIAIIIAGNFMKDYPLWWVMGGGIGIFLVGVFSDFKRSLFLKIAHYLSAISGFVMLGLSFWFDLGNILYTSLIALAAILAWELGRERIWCLELTMSLMVFGGLFFYALGF